jgi:hypothetical protein
MSSFHMLCCEIMQVKQIHLGFQITSQNFRFFVTSVSKKTLFNYTSILHVYFLAELSIKCSKFSFQYRNFIKKRH